MMKAQIERYLKQRVLPFFAGFTVAGRLLYQNVGGLLRGFYFDQSASDSDVLYVHCFVLPLYVPTSVVSFNFGDRLTHPVTGNSGWRIGAGPDESSVLIPRMEEARKVFLDSLSNPCNFAERYSAAALADVNTEEAVAYSWVLCGDWDRALESLSRLQQARVQAPWVAELKERSESIRRLVQGGELAAAQNQLRGWQTQSESDLKL